MASYGQAITIRYLPPTDKRGIRYRAVSAAKSFSYSEIEAFSQDENAMNAAKQLAHVMKWTGAWAGGRSKTGEWVFVLIEYQNTFRIV